MKKIVSFCIAVLVFISFGASREKDYGEYLRNLGYEVSSEFTKETVNIPSEFDAVYENYNLLQKEADFDLAPYKGLTCTRYTYEIYNHPFGDANANIFVYDNKIIGGDISSVKLDGFMTPLT